MTERVGEPAGVARARHMLARSVWAARAFARFDRASVLRIAEAVADAGAARAGEYAEWAVRETGLGVVEHKKIKNEACSRGVFDTYRDHDCVTPRIDVARKTIEVPRPVGVIFARTPSTSPVATIYFKIMLALLTRNAVVVSPHPTARQCGADAARMLADAAVAAGAPDGVVQAVEEPSTPVADAITRDERTDLVLATDDRPGNVPVLVDATADLTSAARSLVRSKAFDNSLSRTNESVLIVEETVADEFTEALRREGAAILDHVGAQRIRDHLCETAGQPASWLAERAGLAVGPHTRVLVAPFDVVVAEEVLAREKLSPVLGMVRVATAARGIRVARAVLRIAGAGHGAAIHSTDPDTVLSYAASVSVPRLTVNAGTATGSAGLGVHLEPGQLVDWTRITYPDSVRMPEFGGLEPWQAPRGPVPAYPVASNMDSEESAWGQ